MHVKLVWGIILIILGLSLTFGCLSGLCLVYFGLDDVSG